jgi:hypothetical protein
MGGTCAGSRERLPPTGAVAHTRLGPHPAGPAAQGHGRTGEAGVDKAGPAAFKSFLVRTRGRPAPFGFLEEEWVRTQQARRRLLLRGRLGRRRGKAAIRVADLRPGPPGDCRILGGGGGDEGGGLAGRRSNSAGDCGGWAVMAFECGVMPIALGPEVTGGAPPGAPGRSGKVVAFRETMIGHIV